MSAEKVINEYKELLATFVRQLALERARSNPDKIKEITAASDDDILRGWLWKFSIIGALLCFVVLPFTFAFLGTLISFMIMELLWLVLKLAMAIVLIAFFFAIYVTVKKPDNKD